MSNPIFSLNFSCVPFSEIEVQMLLAQLPEASEAHMDSHVHEAAQEGMGVTQLRIFCFCYYLFALDYHQIFVIVLQVYNSSCTSNEL